MDKITTLGPHKITHRAKQLGFTVGEIFQYAQQDGVTTTKGQIKYAHGFLDEYQQYLNEIQITATSARSVK